MSAFDVTLPCWVLGLLVIFGTGASRVEAQDLNQSPLAFFVDENAEQVAKFLGQGGNPNADYDRRTALQIAATGGHLRVMKLLIDHGADASAKGQSGRLPLVEAAASLEPQAVKILLDAGAEPTESALQAACLHGRTQAARLLMNAGVSPDAGMGGAASGGHSEILKLLLDEGADVNGRMADGSTPLHVAAKSGGVNTVRLLLGRGADPNATDKHGDTPLHSAIPRGGELKTIQLLVQSGANLDVGNEQGVTPVRLAAMHHANTVYDWLLGVAWGKEPLVVLSDHQRETTKSTSELIVSLSSRNKQARLAAQRELVARGRKVVPDVLLAMKKATSRDPFYELLMAMGPQAEAALPLLESQLGDKKLGPPTLYVIEAMMPGSIAELPAETKQRAMAALYESIADRKTDVLAGFHADILIRIGKPATPTILRLLRHPEPRYRDIMASSLATSRFADAQLQSELVKMSLGDPTLTVRTEAANALGRVGDLGIQARAALLAIVNTPRPHDPYEDDKRKRRENDEWKTATDRAARSLGRFGPSVIDDLIPLLSPLDNPQRLTSITVLASIGSAAVPRLIELLADEDSSIAISASVALNRIGQPAAPALAQAVITGNDQVVSGAANALWWIGRSAGVALPALLEVAGSEKHSDHSRVAAAHAAMRIDPSKGRESTAIQSSIPVLIRILASSNFANQGLAAETLGAIGPAARASLPMLRKRLELPPEGADTGKLARDYVQRNAETAIAAIEADSDKE